MCRPQRMMFCNLIENLLQESQRQGRLGNSEKAAEYKDKALQATRYCDQTIPAANVPYDYTSLTMAQAYCICDAKEDGERIIGAVLKQCYDYLGWGFMQKLEHQNSFSNTIGDEVMTMREAIRLAKTYELNSLHERYNPDFDQFFELAYKKGFLKKYMR